MWHISQRTITHFFSAPRLALWAMKMLILGKKILNAKLCLFVIYSKSQTCKSFFNRGYAVLEMGTCKGLDDHVLAVDFCILHK